MLESGGLILLEWALGHLLEWYKGEHILGVKNWVSISVWKRSSSLAVCNSRKMLSVSQIVFLVYIPTHFYNKYRQENFSHWSSSTVKLGKVFIMGDKYILFNPVKKITLFNRILSSTWEKYSLLTFSLPNYIKQHL